MIDSWPKFQTIDGTQSIGMEAFFRQACVGPTAWCEESVAIDLGGLIELIIIVVRIADDVATAIKIPQHFTCYRGFRVIHRPNLEALRHCSASVNHV